MLREARGASSVPRLRRPADRRRERKGIGRAREQEGDARMQTKLVPVERRRIGPVPRFGVVRRSDGNAKPASRLPGGIAADDDELRLAEPELERAGERGAV